jgi:hypothetical protein
MCGELGGEIRKSAVWQPIGTVGTIGTIADGLFNLCEEFSRVF